MASCNSGSSSGGSGSRSVSLGGTDSCVLCYHDECAVLRVVRAEGPIKGKRFYGCSYWPRTCGFVKWADVPNQVSELQHMLFVKDTTINELHAQNYVLRNKLRKIGMKRADLQDEVEEMGIAQTETMWELKNHITDKKLFVLTFVFFALVLLLSDCAC